MQKFRHTTEDKQRIFSFLFTWEKKKSSHFTQFAKIFMNFIPFNLLLLALLLKDEYDFFFQFEIISHFRFDKYLYFSVKISFAYKTMAFRNFHLLDVDESFWILNTSQIKSFWLKIESILNIFMIYLQHLITSAHQVHKKFIFIV